MPRRTKDPIAAVMSYFESVPLESAKQALEVGAEIIRRRSVARSTPKATVSKAADGADGAARSTATAAPAPPGRRRQAAKSATASATPTPLPGPGPAQVGE
jgi:hypothetical protein